MPQQILSRDYLRILDRFEKLGRWSWDVRADRHSWSAGIAAITGLGTEVYRPHYRLLRALVHPEDAGALPDPAELLQTAERPRRMLRLVRPDGMLRTVLSTSVTAFSPGGRPLHVDGVIVDVSDREVLRRAGEIRNEEQRALFRARGIFFIDARRYGAFEFPPEYLELTGLSVERLREDHRAGTAVEGRDRLTDFVLPRYDGAKPFTVEPTVLVADGSQRTLRSTAVPLRNAAGQVTGWTHMIAPLASPLELGGAGFMEDFNDAIEGGHLRAARALLDWTQTTLAKASALSFSTIRRLEENGEAFGSRTRQIAVTTLRRAGIQFLVSSTGDIVVVKL